MAHAPRVVAMVLVRLAEALGWPLFLGAVQAFMQSAEGLEHLPTRFLTGYYLAVRAEIAADS